MNNTEKKKEALLTYLQNFDETYTMEDISIEREYGAYTEYATPEGTFCIMTEDEAKENSIEYIKNLIDDCGGIEKTFGGNAEYVFDNFVEWDGEEFFREDYQSYYEDIEHEGASCDELFESRLQQEIYEGLINENFDDSYEFDISEVRELMDFINDFDDNRDDYIEEMVDKRIAEIDDYVEEAKFQFGEKFLEGLDVDIDYEGIAEWCVEVDGYGHLFSAWDGKTECIGENNEFYLFKQDERGINRVSDPEPEEEKDEEGIEK